MDKFIVHPIFGPDASVQGADNAGGDRMRKSEGVTDGDNGFTDHEIIAAAQIYSWKSIIGFDLQYSQIKLRICADNLGFIFAFILKNNLYNSGTGNHVGVAND